MNKPGLAVGVAIAVWVGAPHRSFKPKAKFIAQFPDDSTVAENVIAPMVRPVPG